MASISERAKAKLAQIRRRRPFIDHVFRMQEHYGTVDGNLLSGAITYFAFLSFFPVLALAFFVVGIAAKVWPDAEENLTDAIGEVLPGLVGSGDNQISLEQISSSASAVGVIGLLGVAYAGLGWLSAMRHALLAAFEEPEGEKPNFVVGKVRDLVSLLLIGLVLIVSIALSGILTKMTDTILGWLGLGVGLGPVITLIGLAVGLAANSLLFFTIFFLLARPNVPKRSLWSGALLGAIAFELLKQLSTWLIASTKNQPAFQAFGIALILVVWINYFSRVVMYAASWAHTTREAILERQLRLPDDSDLVPEGPAVGPLGAHAKHTSYPASVLVGAGSVIGILIARLVRRRP